MNTLNFNKKDTFLSSLSKLFVLVTSIICFTNCNTSIKQKIAEQSGKEIIRYAKNLSIKNTKDKIMITIKNPDLKGKTTIYTLVKKKSVTKVNQLQIPIQSVITLSTTHIGMLAKLNQLTKIVGATNQNYITIQQ